MNKLQVQAWDKLMWWLPALCAVMNRMRDFFMEISWTFESAVIPFIAKIAPSDMYNIWKRGACLRADMTLAGFDGLRRGTGMGSSRVGEGLHGWGGWGWRVVGRDGWHQEAGMGRQVAMLGRLWGGSVRWSLCITSIHFFKYLGVSCQRPKGGTEKVEMVAEGELK